MTSNNSLRSILSNNDLSFEELLQITMQLLLQNDKELYDEVIEKIKSLLEDIDLNYAKKTDLHEHENKEVLDSITNDKIEKWDAMSNFNGDYNNLINKPEINGEVLTGSKTLNDLGINEITTNDVEEIIKEIGGL